MTIYSTLMKCLAKVVNIGILAAIIKSMKSKNVLHNEYSKELVSPLSQINHLREELLEQIARYVIGKVRDVARPLAFLTHLTSRYSYTNNNNNF